jgi:DNA-binding MarR family transcriptional regulator
MAPAPRWLNNDELRAWRALRITMVGLLATLDRELQREHGLGLAEYDVLVILSEQPDDRLRMSELATVLSLSPSGMTRRIDGLVRSGLVAREQCPEDRRVSYAVLTPAGRRLLETAAPTHVRGVREHFIDRLSARQLGNLASVLSAVQIDPKAAAGGCDDAA